MVLVAEWCGCSCVLCVFVCVYGGCVYVVLRGSQPHLYLHTHSQTVILIDFE